MAYKLLYNKSCQTEGCNASTKPGPRRHFWLECIRLCEHILCRRDYRNRNNSEVLLMYLWMKIMMIILIIIITVIIIVVKKKEKKKKKKEEWYFIERYFTPLSTVFKSYHGDSSHYSCRLWALPVLGWSSEVSLPSILSRKNLEDPVRLEPRSPLIMSQTLLPLSNEGPLEEGEPQQQQL